MRFSWSALLVLASLGLIARPAPAQEQALQMKPGVGRAGAGFYQPDHWGLIRSTLVNNTGAEQNPLLTLSVAGTSEVQYAKRVWLPPNSERITVTPIRLIELKPGADRGVEAQSRLIVERNGREEASPAEIGVLPIRAEGFQTAVVAGQDDVTTRVSSALRAAAGLTPTTSYLSETDVPIMTEAWTSIDALVFSRGEARLNAAQLEAMRRWLVGGGRLWINLQQVDADFARAIVGDAWKVAVLDRVLVNEFAIESGDGRSDRRVEVRRDYPLELVRVYAPDMEVVHRVNGYPASLRMTVGKGQLLVTTLEGPAWLDEKSEANEALKGLSWFARRAESDSKEDAASEILRSVASQQIGYTVMGRAPVITVLGVFTLALLGAGLFLAQRDNLAHLGWLAPVLACVAAAVLLGMGVMRQSETPFTAATAELVEAIPDEPYVSIKSLVSIYTPPGADRSSASLKGAGPVAWPELNAGGGATLRLTWSGDDHWEYSNLPFREGAVQVAHLGTVMPLEKPAVAAVQLVENGLVGAIRAAGIGTLEDAVIVTPAGKLATAPTEDGGFTAGFEDELGPDQFFTGGVLGQRQMTRQGLYRQLLAQPGFPSRPVLLGWAPGIDLDVNVSKEAVTPRQALVVLPLEVEAPPAGQPISIPAPLMRMRRFNEDKRYMSSPVYDERNMQWVENVSTAQIVLMKFELPDAAAALRPESARFAVDLFTPGRPYDLMVYRGGDAVPVNSGVNAASEVVVELSGEQLPDVLPDGSVVVGVRIGEPTDPLKNESWAIRGMQIGVKGVIGESSNPQQP